MEELEENNVVNDEQQIPKHLEEVTSINKINWKTGRQRTNCETPRLIIKNNKILENESFILIRFSNPPGRNLCFSNAAISCLLNNSILRKFLHGYSIEPAKPLTEELKQLSRVKNYHESSTLKLRAIVQLKCFESGQLTKNFNNNKQHDAGEFMQSLLEHLWNENSKNTLKEEMFGGVSQDILTCFCAYRVELAPEQMSEIIPIQIAEQDVQKGLDTFLSGENIAWKCPKCGRPTVQKKRLIVIEPSTLILQLMRYNFDTSNNTASKINDQIFCQPNIFMPSGSTYTLTSIINHHGEETKSGHYNTILLEKESEKYLFLDDTEISYVQDDYNGISDVSYICTFVRDI